MQAEGESAITWDRPAEEYPQALYIVLIITHLERRVVEWADKHLPMAWWKPMFV